VALFLRCGKNKKSAVNLFFCCAKRWSASLNAHV